MADRARFHASLLDETGHVLATARDFLALRLPRLAAQLAPLPEPNAMPTPDPVPGPDAEPAPVPVFVPRWHPTEAVPAAASWPDGVVLILRDEEDCGLGDALAKALGDRGVIQVVLGEATESRAAGVFGIGRADEVAFDRLLAQLKPLAAVYMLGSGRRAGTAAAALEAAARDRSAAADALHAGPVCLARRPWTGPAGAGRHLRGAGCDEGGYARCRRRHAGRPRHGRCARIGADAAFRSRSRAG